jgi:hypothetical protein
MRLFHEEVLSSALLTHHLTVSFDIQVDAFEAEIPCRQSLWLFLKIPDGINRLLKSRQNNFWVGCRSCSFVNNNCSALIPWGNSPRAPEKVSVIKVNLIL